MDASTASERARLRATWRTQANALFRKNLAFEKRNKAVNIFIILSPLFFVVLLFLLQVLINSAINTDDNKCGCRCLNCCTQINGKDVCHDDTPADPCTPGQFDSCAKTDRTACGFKYSTPNQAFWCSIPTPSFWPTILSVPDPFYRAQPSAPALAVPYTAKNQTRANLLAGLLFDSPTPLPYATLASVTTAINATSAKGGLYGEAFGLLGFTLGSGQDPPKHFYSESAFQNNSAVYNVVGPTCTGDVSTAELVALTGTRLSSNISCTATAPQWAANSDAINRELYCGFQQARCNAATNADVFNSYSTAYDFQDVNETGFSPIVFVNETSIFRSNNNGPPTVERFAQSINLAANAWVRWALGPAYSMEMLAIAEPPRNEGKLNLDISSLIGPLFFAWLVQLIFPIMMVNLVYEKEKRLRIMMKMHGLSDAAYWSIMYLWFLILYCIYIIILVVFGSALNLKIFRLTDYSVQIVFFFLWGNCLIAFSFLVSTLFTNSKTATVCAFLWVFGTGLLGNLLLEEFFKQDKSWMYAAELIPAFGLYRGLYEFAQYAFRGAYQNAKGLTWSKMGDDNNHLPFIMGVFAAEWAIFLPLAWYLEQVLPSGIGVRRHWLFFLDGIRKKQAVVNVHDPKTHKGTQDVSDSSVLVQVESSDVRAERERVEAMTGSEGQSMIIKDLRKVYPAQDGNPEKVACKGLTMAVERGECFGLLGPNGAGKSTAINMLVGLLEPSGGSAIVEGLDIRSRMQQVYTMMGVCPQHDLLWETLTAREHLIFYGRLKNLKGPELMANVEAALKSVNLWNGGVANKQIRAFSGGMKRRLSVAISLMGSPLVVYMDEPSTGLDPASRRNLWDVVKAAKAGRGIILTTHSMEEAEVLCDRLGIFVDGQLVCVGNPKELTARHGGYLVFTITTPNNPADLEKAAEFVKEMSPTSRCTYALGGTQKYELPSKEVTLGSVFESMEKAKASFTVLDWGVANATLEEVFIKFARSIGAEMGN